MNPAMIAFFFGVIVGGLGATLLIGLLLMKNEPKERARETQKIGTALPAAPTVKLKMHRALQALWGTLR